VTNAPVALTVLSVTLSGKVTPTSVALLKSTAATLLPSNGLGDRVDVLRTAHDPQR
jgi:hypothetical protein